MSRLVRKIGEFNKSVLTLAAGTAVAQIIPVAISPILTRMYLPSDFGILALFIAISSVLGVIACARYELAIMLPDNEDDALAVSVLALFVATLFSCFLVVVFLIFGEWLGGFWEGRLQGWIYLIPLVVWFMAIFSVLNYFFSRRKKYREIALSNIYKSILSAGAQLVLGAFKFGASGLLVGQVVGVVFGSFRMLGSYCREPGLKRYLRAGDLFKQAAKYKDFPMYSIWAALANALSISSVGVLISVYYSVAALGMYALVQRILGGPIVLVSSSFGQVFYQRASVELRETGGVYVSFIGTLKKLVLVSFVPFLVLFFFVEDLVSVVFGPDWLAAGKYAQILVPVFAVRFVVSPLSLVNQVLQNNRIGMCWQIVLLIGTALSVAVSAVLGASIEDGLLALSVFSTFWYLVLLYWIFPRKPIVVS